VSSEELLKSMSTDIRGLGDDAQKRFAEIQSRLLLVEQKQDAQKFTGGGFDGGDNNIGAKVTESEQFRGLQLGGRSTGKISVGNLKTALINAVGQNQPLVQSDRTAIIPGVTRRLSVRDVLPSSPTSSNAIDVVKESSFTNNAAPQYSAGAYENVIKAESALSFSLTTMGVSTIAHLDSCITPSA
jgi:hypothetical protein